MIMENEYILSEEFQAYGDKLKNGISEFVTLESTLLDGNAVGGEGESEPLKCMQDFLDASLVGDKDTAMKKLFTAGFVLAKDSGTLPFELSDGASKGIATIVDNGLTRIKIAYKTAKGEISAEEGMDLLIDHAVARTMAVADVVVNTVEANVEVICDAISLAFPSAAVAIQLLKPVIKTVVTRVAPKVKEAIHVGIVQVSQFSKEAARSIIANSREIRANVKNRQLNAIYG